MPAAASAPGLPDPLQPTHAASALLAHKSSTTPHTHVPAPQSAHPLEARLAGWRATQHSLKMEGLRRAYGMAEPMRREMELGFARGGEWRPRLMGGSAGVSGDVLEGRDTVVEWEDVFNGVEREEGDLGRGKGVLGEVEGRLGMHGI